jgi:tetratricopeptide (TPR) repeat protein
MIVRNEEAFLAQCLDSARDAVDEIIVVDTGSEDRTMEIARERGAKVFTFPWQDDFSAARNEALNHARGDWILALDADEYLEEGAPQALRAAALDERHAGYMMPLVNLMEAGKRTSCMMMRFHVNRPEIRYRYLIHEQVLPDLTRYARRAGMEIGRLKARILHQGYHRDCMMSRNKIERNEKLFAKQLALYPRDLYSWYKYVEFLFSAEAPKDRVLESLDHAHALLEELDPAEVRSLPFAGELAAYLAMAWFEEKLAPEKAHELLERYARICSPTPHLFFTKAGTERALGLYEEALESYGRCLSLHGRPLTVAVTEGVTSWRSRSGMGFCLLEQGALDAAEACFMASLEGKPDETDPHAGMADVAYRRGDMREALQWIMKLLEKKPDHAPAWSAGGEMLERMGMHEEADRWRRKADHATTRKGAPVRTGPGKTLPV